MEGPANSVKSFVSESSAPIDKKIIFGVQVAAVLLLAVFCLINLTVPGLENEKFEKLWIGLLGSCVGYLLPNPSLKIVSHY